MGFRDLVRHYQTYDPVTRTFTAQRSDRQYANILGIQRALLSRFYSGHIRDSHSVLSAFLRTFPEAAHEIARSMLAEVAD